MVGRQQQETQQEPGAPTGGPSQGPLPSIAQKVLDRQIRLWGLEAQKKLLEARVLVVGLSAVNVEASKDLALAGVSQTLCDGRPWNEEELRFNFLPALAAAPVDLHCSTAEASKQGLESIASFVSFSALPPEAVECTFTSASGDSRQTLEDLVKQYACVCVAAEVFPIHTLGALAAACRKGGVGLIISQCCGSIGFFVQDFGTCEPGKEEGAQPTLPHPPLLDVLSSRLRDLDPKVDPAIYAVLGESFTCVSSGLVRGVWILRLAALLRFESNQSAPRRPLGSIDPLAAEEAAKIELAAAGVLAVENLNPSPSMQRAIRDLALGYNQQTNATAAVVGGLLAQEVRKYITREQKAVPIPNVVVFDSYSSCASVARVPPLTPPNPRP
ncbi:hypothetical protein Esti_002742 [Eimeria stiedai]